MLLFHFIMGELETLTTEKWKVVWELQGGGSMQYSQRLNSP